MQAGERLNSGSFENISAVTKSDQELISETVAGQTEAFNLLVLRYQDRLFNALVKILRSRDDARDIAQEAFVTAWRKLGDFRGEAGFYSWLFRIAYNTAMSRQRRRTISAHSLHQSEDTFLPPEDDRLENMPSHRLELSEQQQTIRLALEHLPEEYRTVLILKEIENFKYEQIAEIMEVPLGTIRSRIHRARLLLRESLTRLLPDGEELSRVSSS